MNCSGFFSRLFALWKEFWTSHHRSDKARDPMRAYESALAQRRQHLRNLMRSASQLILLRNRTQAKLQANKETLKLLEDAITKAATTDSDTRAIALIRKTQQVREQNERIQTDTLRLETQINRAKNGIDDGRREIENIEQERDEITARQNYAFNRLQLQELFKSSEESAQEHNATLEIVRDEVARLEIQAELLEDPDLTIPTIISASQLRDEAKQDKAEEELRQRKMILSGKLLNEGTSNPEPNRAPQHHRINLGVH